MSNNKPEAAYRHLSSQPSPGLRLDIAAFSKLSAERAETGFKTYRNVPVTYWTTALMGEGGELCNMVKKMERVAHGGIDGGSSYTAASLKKEDLAEEIGGIFIYLNILSGLLDIDMEEAIIETFNSKSKKYGFVQFYPATPPAQPIEGEQKSDANKRLSEETKAIIEMDADNWLAEQKLFLNTPSGIAERAVYICGATHAYLRQLSVPIPASEVQPIADSKEVPVKTWPLAGYAPGNYSSKCVECGNVFVGDKRAVQCLECAVRLSQMAFDQQRIIIAAKETQIAGLLESNKEWGDKYVRTQQEANDYLNELNIITGDMPDNSTMVARIRKTLSKYISSPIDKANGRQD